MNKINYVNKLFGDLHSMARHSHDFWEVVYFTCGPGTIVIGDHYYTFDVKDVFVIPPNTPHLEYCECKYTNVHLSFIDNNFTGNTLIRFKDTENEVFLTVLTLIYNEYHLKRKNWQSIIDNLLQVMYNYIFSLSAAANNVYVESLISDIISNIPNVSYDINVSIAKIPLHRDYLRRLFIKETGLSPSRFLREKRMSHAKQLLTYKQNSHLNVTEIANQCGYNDVFYFSKIFKKCTGFSPNNWLKNEHDYTWRP